MFQVCFSFWLWGLLLRFHKFFSNRIKGLTKSTFFMRYGAVNKSYAFLTQRSTQRSSCLEMLIKSFAFVSPKVASGMGQGPQTPLCCYKVCFC
ncbi:MAG: hypothetical protein EOO34_00320 [Cyanobacteriota bacterium]|nr:MAG: hypothetical protein EOO34_00320 [Cyanobacteriota bacterium]